MAQFDIDILPFDTKYEARSRIIKFISLWWVTFPYLESSWIGERRGIL